MASSGHTQELPPPGGYSRIIYEKIPAINVFSARRLFAGYVLGMGATFIGSYFSFKLKIRRDAEQMSGHIALQPFFLAENDRLLLKQVRKNRDSEAELMKNVKHWEVGTLFGSPVYSTVGPDQWVEPHASGIYVHNDPAEVKERIEFRLWL